MFLSRFGVKNYKCLGDIDIPLTPLHVLIAQNDSGKTSLMEAVVALYGSLQKPPEELFPKPGQGRQECKSWRFHSDYWQGDHYDYQAHTRP